MRLAIFQWTKIVSAVGPKYRSPKFRAVLPLSICEVSFAVFLLNINLKMRGVDFYKGFTSFAQYGPMYQRVTACYRGVNPQGQDEVLVQVRGTDTDIPE